MGAADSVPAEVDAIIVPTSRPTANLSKAIALAAELGCLLVALCSQQAKADDAKVEARKSGVKIVAIDTDALPPGLMPEFATSTRLRSTEFHRSTDLSSKRNLGLLLADVIDWQRIVFLDDDITVTRTDDLRDAAGLLSCHAAVGLANDGYHDNSVVCHAYRDAGGHQESFIGGGALAVGDESFRSFFPNIYSEDWFFLIGENNRLRRTAVTGKALQSPYDPFSDIRRARAEEFGDCLAEGIYRLLDSGGRIQDATFKYWRGFLDSRRRFIGDVRRMVAASDLDSALKARRLAALTAARNRSMSITPKLCVDYLQWWRADRDRWALHLEDIRLNHGHGLEVEKAFASLGLMDCSLIAA
jgi:hypothetical protein